MPKISVTATCRRNPKGFFEDVVILVIAGREFVHKCSGPEDATRTAENTLKELGLWQSTSTD